MSLIAQMALRQENVIARLIELRARHELTQEKAASRAGITSRQWQRWEAGVSMPYARTLSLVAEAFGVDVAYFEEPVEESTEPPDDVWGALGRIESKLDELLAIVSGSDDGGGDPERAVHAVRVASGLQPGSPTEPSTKPS